LTHQITLHCGESAAFLLKKTWVEVSDQTDDFFLSQTWIDYYLSRWPETDRYCVVSENDRALASLSRGIYKSRLQFSYASLGINASSSEGLQSATLETNGAIGSNANELLTKFPAILEALLENSDWDEIRLDALLKSDADEIAKMASSRGLMHHTDSENQTYLVDLEKTRSEFSGDFIASRSSNTRAQLRKALRRTEQELGKVVLNVADSREQATYWLGELAALHKIRWNSNGEVNGFENPTFNQFQQGLVRTCFDHGELQMLRLDAGMKPLAYLYNFQYKGHVLFYMSGVDYNGTEAYKPGLLAHWFAIEHNLAAGAKTYDFLAGTNRYKESLCTHGAVRVCLRLRRPTFFFKAEHWLRQLKRARSKP
jgi:Acetyltransferase (GNAT) domain